MMRQVQATSELLHSWVQNKDAIVRIKPSYGSRFPQTRQENTADVVTYIAREDMRNRLGRLTRQHQGAKLSRAAAHVLRVCTNVGLELPRAPG